VARTKLTPRVNLCSVAVTVEGYGVCVCGGGGSTMYHMTSAHTPSVIFKLNDVDFCFPMEQLDILRCQVWKSHLCPKGPISVQPL
jgi:hypothetical protein